MPCEDIEKQRQAGTAHLNCLQIDEEVLWLEVCLAKADVHIPGLVRAVLHLASLEVSHCLQGTAAMGAQLTGR